MEHLVLVITEKKKLGWSLVPFWAETNGDLHIVLHEQANSEHIKSNKYTYSKSSVEVLKKLDTINEQGLHKRFSKQKTVKQFFDELQDKYVNEHIRPKMEKTIHEVLEIVSLDDTPVYFKNSNYTQIYPSDRVKISALYDQTHFAFDLKNDGLTYSLQISSGTNIIGLLNREVVELSINPAILYLNNRLYRFQNIDSKKFRPFYTKSHVMVPLRSVPTYMNSFVQNCVKDHSVKATGFEIINSDVPVQPRLYLESDLSLNPTLTLRFKYGEKELLASDPTPVFVSLKEQQGRYTFLKLKRNKEKEVSVIELLKSFGLKLTQGSQYHPSNSSKEVVELVAWLSSNKESLMDAGIEMVQNIKNIQYYVGNINLDFLYDEQPDWFDLQMTVITDNYTFPFFKLRKNILAKKREYTLPNGEIFIIPLEWFSKYTDLMHFAKVEDESFTLDKMHFNLLDADNTKKDWREGLDKLKNLTDRPIFEVSTKLKATLRPYQLEGCAWMSWLFANHFGGILADDMGLGKTIQTITLLCNQYESEDETLAQPVGQLNLFDSPITGFNTTTKAASLIVMPTSLVHNWANELSRFAPHLKVYIYSQANRLKSKDIGKILRHYHVILASYGIVRNDIDYLSTYPFNTVILDESQNIKNPSSKIYQAVTELKATNYLALTGTPIENSLTDLWAQFNFVNRDSLKNLTFFKNHYVNPIEKLNSDEKGEKLKQLIDPFILRRTKDMVAKELPPISEQVLYCDMTEEQTRFYEKEKSSIRNLLLKAIEETGVNKNAILALQALTKLRQIANHPVFVDANYKGSSGKYEQIFENLDNVINEGHKVLVFSSYKKDLHLIADELDQKHVKYALLTGDTTNREAVVDEFTKNTNCKVFLISLKAGGVGLNLIEAEYVFMLNPWWNPAAEEQAINRAHRIGQTKNVFVYRFISTNSIEEKIMKLQEKKSKLADTFITTENSFKNLSADDIKELFA